MLDLIKWYYNSSPFTENEKVLLDTLRTPDIEYNDIDYKELTQQYFDRMPFCNLTSDDRYITFDESGTALIDKVFEKEVDDDTLIISTVFEHSSVKKYLNGSNTLLFQSIDDMRHCDYDIIIEKAKQYKKVFVYIIGTRIDTGEIIPQWFLEELKQILDSNNIENKMMLDDVHGMFIVPRDYRIFDYVLYTAHAIVLKYEMGLLISKTNDIGKRAYNWGKEYLEKLDILLKRKDKMEQMVYILTHYFNKMVLTSPYLDFYKQTVGHIFSIKTTDLYFSEKDLEELNEKYMIENSNNDRPKENWLRWRFQEFITLSEEEVVNGIKLLEKVLKRAIMMSRMKEGQ